MEAVINPRQQKELKHHKSPKKLLKFH